ncbi:hypothetical protein HY772_07140 [Candidatus Woesearchaeota archaeon]|nr:hypothetical protein [Candidatus Woesearchaeota archaeon]
MSKPIFTPANFRAWGIGIAMVQLADIVIHAATDQLEILRVSSNGIVLIWLAVVMTGKFNVKFLQTAVASISAYLILNLIFLAREGTTNVEQGGELRTMLFLLMFLTITLSIWLTYLLRNTKQ